MNELKDFLLKFPVVLEKHLSSVCDKLVELMLDSSGDVRMALYTLLDEVLPMLPETLVSPFFPLWVAYISTGMTHVNGAVRLDALQYTNLWLHYHPSLVAKFHSKLLPHFMTLMTMRDPPPSAGDGLERIRRLPQKEKVTPGKPSMHAAKLHIPNALKMKNVLLASLYELVVAQLGHAELYEYKDEVDGATDCVFEPPLVVPFQPSYTTDQILLANPSLRGMGNSIIESTTKQNEDLSPSESKLHLNEPECFKYFFTVVFPLLISQWIECGPEELVSHSLKPLESILKLFDFMLSHLGSLIGDDPESQAARHIFLEPYLRPLQQHVLGHFPFDYPPGFSDDELSIITHLNVLICMVASHFYSDETRSSSWGRSILNYTLKAFSGNISRPQGRKANGKNSSMDVDEEDDRQVTKKDGKKKIGLSTSVHFQIVGELLPVIRRLNEYTDDKDRLSLLQSFQAFNDSCPPASASKRMSISFLSTLLLDYEMPESDDDDSEDEDSMKGQTSTESAKSGNSTDEISDEVLPLVPRPPVTMVPVNIIANLLVSLPKTLWQLQHTAKDTTKLILGVLNSFGSRFGSVESPLSTAFSKLQPALVPFFWTSIAKKAKKKVATKDAKMETSDASAAGTLGNQEEEEDRKEIFGPFIKLPVDVQKRAIDVVSQFRPFSPAMIDSLLHALSSSKVSNEVVSYFFDSIEAVGSHFESEGDFASFALSFLVSIANNACANDDDRHSSRLQRCYILARTVARACARLGMGVLFLEIIDETLIQLLESVSSTTTSKDQEFVLGLTITTFLGAFVRHIDLNVTSDASDASDVSPSLPSSLSNTVESAVYSLLRISAVAEQKAHFRPGPIMVKDLVVAIPSILDAIISKFSKEVRGENILADAHSRLLLNIVTRFSSQANAKRLANSSTLESVLEAVKGVRKSDTKVERALAEMKLITEA